MKKLALLILASLAAPASGQEPTALQAALVIEQALVDAIGRAEKSVVAISRVRRGTEVSPGGVGPTHPDFIPTEYGTGVVVDAKGLILTNYHVIGKPEENDYIVWSERRPYRVTRVKAADPWTDLAVLEISGGSLPPITLGDGSKLRKGQIVIALGNPYAIARDGQASASWGIISNLSRKATKNPTRSETIREGKTLHHFGTLIQTDARLNLGTSGGALLNLKGEMIGLTSSMAAMHRYEKSAGFAIPVDDHFKQTLEKLKRGQKAEFGFLGVSPEERSEAERRQGALGVRISDVVRGTPAAAAGLQTDDLITHVEGRPIHSRDDLMRDLGRNPVGSALQLTIQRSGRVFSKTATLSKKYVEASRPALSQTPDRSWRGMRVDYATAVPRLGMADFLPTTASLDPEGCVAIVQVDPDSTAWKAGLRPNTFVSFVDRQRVRSPDEFYTLVAERTGDVQIRLSAPQGSSDVIRTVTPE